MSPNGDENSLNFLFSNYTSSFRNICHMGFNFLWFGTSDLYQFIMVSFD